MTVTTAWDLFEDLRAAQDEMLRATRAHGWRPGQHFTSGTTPAAWAPARVTPSSRQAKRSRTAADSKAAAAPARGRRPGRMTLLPSPLSTAVTAGGSCRLALRAGQSGGGRAAG